MNEPNGRLLIDISRGGAAEFDLSFLERSARWSTYGSTNPRLRTPTAAPPVFEALDRSI
jgi:hypothetical protein